MPYLIDGHNLIPYISGINLSDLDDEIKLIQSLQKLSNKRRSKIEVYFDQAHTVQTHSQNHGLLKAVFVQQDSTADNAIKTRLSQLGKGAKNWTVVSSDREVRVEARSYRSKLLTSPEFARLLRNQLTEIQKEGGETDSPDQSNLEVEFWMDQFSQD
jgi:predicted RNA-binding protein with PIN domain